MAQMLLLLIVLQVVRSDRVTREEIAQGGVASSGPGGAVTTTMEKTSTGDATFFISPSGTGSQQGMISVDPNNSLAVTTRSIDPSGGMYGPSFGGFGGYSGFGSSPSFAGSPFMGGFGGAPLYAGGSNPFVVGGGEFSMGQMGGANMGGMYSPFGGVSDPSMMNPMTLYQQMLYYRQMAQFLLGQRSSVSSGASPYSPPATPYAASPFPYARYILRDKLKTTRKD